MIHKLAFDEDLELKRFTATPKEDKPRFDWRGALNEEKLTRPEIKVESAGEERAFDLAEIADTIGTALTDLLLSRREEEFLPR